MVNNQLLGWQGIMLSYCGFVSYNSTPGIYYSLYKTLVDLYEFKQSVNKYLLIMNYQPIGHPSLKAYDNTFIKNLNYCIFVFPYIWQTSDLL